MPLVWIRKGRIIELVRLTGPFTKNNKKMADLRRISASSLRFA
jgi:hypothetical protein